MTDQLVLVTRRSGGALEVCLRDSVAQLGACTAMASSPSGFTVHRVDDVGAHDPELPPGVFEARWFNREGEVRWVKRGDGGESASLRVEGAESNTLGDRRVLHSTLERTYRLWGENHEINDGWAIISSPRTAQIAVPVDSDDGSVSGLVLSAFELVEDLEGSGNLRVVEELLVAIRPLQQSGGDPDE